MSIRQGITREQAKACVGEGWSNLVDTFYDAAEPLNLICVYQVKEKFGCLRIYFGHYCPEVEDDFNDDSILQVVCPHDFTSLMDLADSLERNSAHVCEACGQAGTLSGGKYGWIKCLCETCRNEGL